MRTVADHTSSQCTTNQRMAAVAGRQQTPQGTHIHTNAPLLPRCVVWVALPEPPTTCSIAGHGCGRKRKHTAAAKPTTQKSCAGGHTSGIADDASRFWSTDHHIFAPGCNYTIAEIPIFADSSAPGCSRPASSSRVAVSGLLIARFDTGRWERMRAPFVHLANHASQR